MEFLGIGYQELILVFVLLLVVVGPERLPQMAYQIGRAVRTMQRYARAVRDEFREEIDYVEEQVKTVRGELDTTRTAMKDQEREFRAEMRALDEAAKVDLPPLIEPEKNGKAAVPANGATSATAIANGTVAAPSPAAAAVATNGTGPADSAEKPPAAADSGKKPLVF